MLNSADLVVIARTDVAAAAGRLRAKLVEGPPPIVTMVCLHGDVHVNNVLFHGDQVHLIDFDQGRSGAASADLGSMLAMLMTAQLVDPDEPNTGLAAAFLEGYEKIRTLPDAAELRWYTDAALVVGHAIRAVNTANLPTLAILPDLLQRAEAVLAGKVRIDG